MFLEVSIHAVAFIITHPVPVHGLERPREFTCDPRSPLQVTREMGALLPTVCAMALLPAGPVGQAYAPAALRHLMTDPDSPVADLYQSCSTCDALRHAESIATLALMEVSQASCDCPWEASCLGSKVFGQHPVKGRTCTRQLQLQRACQSWSLFKVHVASSCLVRLLAYTRLKLKGVRAILVALPGSISIQPCAFCRLVSACTRRRR